MECQFCHCEAPGLIKKAVYGDGIWVCKECYELIDEHRYHPYSKVIDKLAMLEAGYYANRKLARIRKG
jgi:ribosomal protein L37AE/L43A